MYDNVECAFVISGQLTEWFRVEIGVKQVCLSPILFSLFLEFLESLCKEFKPDNNLSFDIRYADDTTIMSTVSEKLQLSTEELLPVGNGIWKSTSPNARSTLRRRRVLFWKT